MGRESARKEMAGDLRRKIGSEAAGAVGELRELVERTQRDMRALAVGLAAIEKRVDAAAAAPAELRKRFAEHELASADAADQLAAMQLRIFDGPLSLYRGLSGRLERLENLRAAAITWLVDRHHEWSKELRGLSRLRWRRRRYVVEQMTDTMSLIRALRATE